MNTLIFPTASLCGICVWVMVLVGMLTAPPAPMAAQDSYLEALEGEIDKVEPNAIGSESATTSTPESRQEAALVRNRFESMLQQGYSGTHSFYSRLPERSRQEIVGEYRNGADIVQLRQMIIDRFYSSK